MYHAHHSVFRKLSWLQHKQQSLVQEKNWQWYRKLTLALRERVGWGGNSSFGINNKWAKPFGFAPLLYPFKQIRHTERSEVSLKKLKRSFGQKPFGWQKTYRHSEARSAEESLKNYRDTSLRSVWRICLKGYKRGAKPNGFAPLLCSFKQFVILSEAKYPEGEIYSVGWTDYSINAQRLDSSVVLLPQNDKICSFQPFNHLPPSFNFCKDWGCGIYTTSYT